MTLKPSVFHGSVDIPLPNEPEARARKMALCAHHWSRLLSALEAGVAEQEAAERAVAAKPNGAPVESKPLKPKQRKRKRGRR